MKIVDFLQGQKYFYCCLSRNLTFMSTEIYHILIACTHYFKKIIIMFMFFSKGKKQRFLTLRRKETMMKKRETPQRLLHLATVQQKSVSKFIAFIVTRHQYILHKSKII